ncbi:hypothetical protein [Arenicella xantha]|uniref:Uncharacterized protein n=1 Tax=Arenicella xantha TaxID=644221 RepID=A0A395JNJ5_9GAMM|nr:hypothetical protein [Arenicella xantha]RBP53230.1 hypothetical protein DFR28_101616 [Arenicella xantha]
MSDKHHSRLNSMRYLLMLLALLLSGCASNVVVKSNIPTPLIERLPIVGAIRYTDDFENYRYTETEKKRALQTLDFTDAQRVMFNQIFGSLMTVVPLDSPDRQLVIEPEILDMQYTAPRETKLNQYEIWIKYRIKLVDADEQKIADWIIKGYGKTPTAMLGSSGAGFSSAANIALRDVGAQLSIGFARQARIRALVKRNAESSSSIELATQSQAELNTKAQDEEVEE